MAAPLYEALLWHRCSGITRGKACELRRRGRSACRLERSRVALYRQYSGGGARGSAEKAGRGRLGLSVPPPPTHTPRAPC